MKILYLEDDYILAETLQEYLLLNEYSVHCVYDAQEALEAACKESFDLFLLDVNVPEFNGFELLKQLRKADIDTPTIFVTSLSSIDDISKGYDAGADDYIKKPFVFEELNLRIKALLKREFKIKNTLVHINDNTVFDPFSGELCIDNKSVSLNPKEILLLKLLLKNRANVVSFEAIFQNVWSFDETHSELSLRTYIKNLRKHIGKNKIVSVKKIGYKLI